ncbi:MAG: hypothetical protein KDC83_14145 [Flavobacteriales bacterium]|nr:hypothetical protein [Flavobacteriales bacterium]
MKNYNVIFSKGHLVDKSTGKRLHLQRGAEFSIQGDNEAFEEQDALMQKPKVLTSLEKAQQIKKKHSNSIHLKIADTGQKLAFRVGLSTRTKEDKKRVYWFVAELLEDLYLFENKSGAFNLFDCHCKTDICTEGNLMMYEPIYGNSLSALFRNTVNFYFSLQHSGAANAFKTFYYIRGDQVTGISNPSDKNLVDQSRKKAIEIKKAEQQAKLLLELQKRNNQSTNQWE